MKSENRGLSASPLDKPNRLWLVDNREEFRALYVTALNAYGIACERQFGSAEELIEVLKQTSGPDLLLLDNGLPGISGAAAVKMIKSHSPATLVFVVSSLKNYCDAAEALGGGASAYFEKRDSIEAMVISMRVALARREALTEQRGRNPNAVGIRT